MSPLRIAKLTFGLAVFLLLGTNSASGHGGLLSWLPVSRLPGPGGAWVPVGLPALLPALSLAAWGLGRLRQPGHRFDWGRREIMLPLVALAGLAWASLAVQCLGGACHAAAFVRVAVLLAAFGWVYLFILNEQPDLLALIAPIVVLQALVAIGQTIAQRDLGLVLLGELPLDPARSGVSVVMNEGERWLRGYGLTTHPNSTGRTLTAGLLMLMVLWPAERGNRRVILVAAALIGLGGLLATASRWSLACLLIGLVVAAWPLLRRGVVQARTRSFSPAAVAVGLAFLLTGLVLGGPLVSRFNSADSAIESRSIWERQRDLTIAARLMAESPLTGTGFGRYLTEARRLDAWAEPVHNVSLQLGAELGLAGLALWGLLVGWPLAWLWRQRGAAAAGLWLGFWCLGLLYVNPHPLVELRSALLAGVVAGLACARPREDLIHAGR